MLRVLYILLAVLAVVLIYIVVPDLLLPLLGVLLLVVTAGMALGRLFGRKKDDLVKPAGDPRDQELSSLGIVAIRPKGTGPVDEDTDGDGLGAVRTAQRREPAQSDDGPPPAGGAFGVSAATVRRKSIAEAHATDERLKKDMLVPFLHAVQAAVGATTVCLLKQDETGLRYHLEAIVSKNGYVRSYGDFSTKAPLLPGRKARKPVTLLRVGEKGVPPKSLGYYAEPIAVRQIALAIVPQPDAAAPFILLADTMEEGGLGTRRQRTLLEQFAGVLGTILDAHETLEEEVEETEPPEVEEPRPRRDIIAEEMRNARTLELPLALSLVYLNRAEEVAQQGEEAVLDAETNLETHLRNYAEGTDAFRIERFGELTFGVFYRGGVEDVESWAMDLQHDLAEPLEGGVSIGIAVMQDHHENPDTLRADATEALREAFETGTCTIIG